MDLNTTVNLIVSLGLEINWDKVEPPTQNLCFLGVQIDTCHRILELPPDKLKKIREEIGDVMIYLVRLSDKLGIDLLQAAKDKNSINKKKYPVDKAKGRALKYNEI